MPASKFLDFISLDQGDGAAAGSGNACDNKNIEQKALIFATLMELSMVEKE